MFWSKLTCDTWKYFWIPPWGQGEQWGSPPAWELARKLSLEESILLAEKDSSFSCLFEGVSKLSASYETDNQYLFRQAEVGSREKELKGGVWIHEWFSSPFPSFHHISISQQEIEVQTRETWLMWETEIGKPVWWKWTSLREPEAFRTSRLLIFKFSHQQLHQAAEKLDFWRRAGHLPGPLVKLHCKQSCFCRHFSFWTSPRTVSAL